MSDLDNAINSINASAAKAENTAAFLDDMSTFDDQSSVTNPNNGQTVASIPKQVKDRTDELFTAAESDINQAVADAEQSATDAQDAADSIGRYQGLWPDTGGSANKGDTYQTQVGGAPTGQYFTALQNTTVDPVGDDVNWREQLSEQSLGGLTNYQSASIADMVAGITVGGFVDFKTGDSVNWLYEDGVDRGKLGFGVVTDDNTAIGISDLYIALNNGKYVLKLNVFGNVEIKTPNSFPDSHALIQSVNSGATRIHQEPNGNISSGTTAKYDWMFDPYDSDPNNYRIFSNYTYVGDPNGTGEGSVGVINSKSAGAAWGNWPSVHFSFGDDSVSPMKMMYFDTSDDQWRAPMKGMWHEGKTIVAGDYVTASNKVYKAVTSGTTGGTIPSHTSGNTSDGGITWEFNKAPSGASIKPCMVFGDRDDMPLFGFPSARAQFVRPFVMGPSSYMDMVGDSGLLNGRIGPRDGGSGERITEWYTYDGSGRLILDGTNKNLQTTGLGNVKTHKTQSATDSPSVLGTELVRFGNTVAQDILRFNDMTPNQVFMVDTTTTGSGFTTIKQTTGIKLSGGVDVVLDEFTVLMFKANFDGTRAIQVN